MRMTCREVAMSVHDLIDDELRFGTRLATRAHLLICRDCRAYLGHLRRTVDLLGASFTRMDGDASDILASLLAERAVVARRPRPPAPSGGGL